MVQYGIIQRLTYTLPDFFPCTVLTFTSRKNLIIDSVVLLALSWQYHDQTNCAKINFMCTFHVSINIEFVFFPVQTDKQCHGKLGNFFS